MTDQATLVTAAEIGRIAGVTRATVSNWRRRHGDFPAPIGGSDASPLYDLTAVRTWLDARGQASGASPVTELRTVLRLHPDASQAVSRLLPLVAALSKLPPSDMADLAELSDKALTARANSEATGLAEAVPGVDTVRYLAADAPAIRALLVCVRAEGGQAALDALAERELDDSAAAGAYQTPTGLARLMASLLTVGCVRVLDPACGSGTLLEAAARRSASELYGQDVLPVQARRAAVSLMLSSPDAQVRVRAGDSLRADAFPDVIADGVLCNPPYGDRDWGHEELAYDPRWAYGVPSRGESELAWMQHALAHLKPDGYAVFLVPPGVAFRTSGRRIRAELTRAGAIRAVVGLPARASMPLHIGLQVWVLQRPEVGGAERRSVLFIDANASQRQDNTTSPEPVGSSRPRHRRESLDWDSLTSAVLGHWERFREAADTFEDTAGEARAVSILDLLDDVVDLTPTRHVRVAPTAADPAAVSQLARTSRDRLAKLVNSFAASASYGDWQPVGDTPREWRTATIADLARGGAIEMLRTTPGTKDDALEAWRTENEGRRVLTALDIARDEAPSGSLTDLSSETAPIILEGDVLLRSVAGGGGPMARVAGEDDAGSVLGRMLLLLRPDPSRLDAWFLAGFLDDTDNIAGASTGTATIQVQPGRLRVPLLPLDEQRHYGEAFRRIRELRTAASRAADASRDAAALLATGLTTGALLPPDHDSG
ncbi:N-6 DNA methylase [Yinghuangia seranimata]|uniref:N-6 DNA methylase n=1 Tax=Yinghuangia seranimata TaxID=408067 RepID=UPI00248BB3D8|nr:N-6 DNA methylase [Yinghuangia seranimata]MDI2125093.1 N-6 DNA methylase [Yinghuangia seranimata]